MSWHNDFGDGSKDDDRDPVLTTGDMAGGDHVDLDVRAEPEVVDTDNGDALRVPVTFRGSPHTFETRGGRPFEPGMKVVLITWSKRLGRALEDAERAYSGPAGGLAGAELRLQKHGSGFDVEYNATLRDGDGDDD
jgi:hypothetical protein